MVFMLLVGLLNLLSNNCNKNMPQDTHFQFSHVEPCSKRLTCGYLISFLGFIGISQPYRIDIFEDYIYGTGLKHEVFKIHKYGKQPVEFLNLGIEKPTNVLISHRYKQQDGMYKNIYLLFFFFWMNCCVKLHTEAALSMVNFLFGVEKSTESLGGCRDKAQDPPKSLRSLCAEICADWQV